MIRIVGVVTVLVLVVVSTVNAIAGSRSHQQTCVKGGAR